MALGEVTPDHVSERRAYVSSQSLQPPFFREHASGSFGGEVVFGGEMAIKTTVREAGAFHDVRDANSVEATLAKKRARYLQNLVSIGRGLLARHSHGCPFPIHLTLYMITVINTIYMTVIIKMTDG